MLGVEDWDYDFEDGDGGGRGDDAFRRRGGKVLHGVGNAAWFRGFSTVCSKSKQRSTELRMLLASADTCRLACSEAHGESGCPPRTDCVAV